MITSSQTLVIAGAQSITRPSTSPIPSLFADAKKASIPRPAAPVTRLRPLPPCAGFAGPMLIEGNRTGEEKLVTVVERRESKPSKASAPLETGLNKDQMLAKEQSRNRKLEQELKRVQELLRAKTLECATLNDRLATTDSVIGQLQHQHTTMVREHATVIAVKDTEIASLRERLDRALHELQVHVKDQERRRSDEMSQHSKMMSKHEEAEKSLMRRAHDLEAINSSLSTEVIAAKSRADQLQKQLDAAKEEAADSQRRAANELREARARESKLQSEVAEFKKLLQEREGKFVEWQGKVEDVNKYIVRICQPQFTVVKDETLAPMPPPSERNPNDPVEGFVLVPLSLMLEGYGLLPTDSKKRINDDYEVAKTTDTRRTSSMVLSKSTPTSQPLSRAASSKGF